MVESVLFAVAVLGLLVSAGGVIVARSPLRGALSLIVALCFVALLFLLLQAPFVATMQVLVYAGAIMVLFVFVIMMLNLDLGFAGRPGYLSPYKVFGLAAVVALLARGFAGTNLLQGGPGESVDGSVKSVGQLLLSDYLFGFEAISVLLLVAVVGAVVMGMKRLT